LADSGTRDANRGNALTPSNVPARPQQSPIGTDEGNAVAGRQQQGDPNRGLGDERNPRGPAVGANDRGVTSDGESQLQTSRSRDDGRTARGSAFGTDGSNATNNRQSQLDGARAANRNFNDERNTRGSGQSITANRPLDAAEDSRRDRFGNDALQDNARRRAGDDRTVAPPSTQSNQFSGRRNLDNGNNSRSSRDLRTDNAFGSIGVNSSRDTLPAPANGTRQADRTPRTFGSANSERSSSQLNQPRQLQNQRNNAAAAAGERARTADDNAFQQNRSRSQSNSNSARGDRSSGSFDRGQGSRDLLSPNSRGTQPSNAQQNPDQSGRRLATPSADARAGTSSRSDRTTTGNPQMARRYEAARPIMDPRGARGRAQGARSSGNQNNRAANAQGQRSSQSVDGRSSQSTRSDSARTDRRPDPQEEARRRDRDRDRDREEDSRSRSR
jgi:hypothetical protein